MILVSKSLSNRLYGIFIVSCYYILPLFANFIKSIISTSGFFKVITCLSFMLQMQSLTVLWEIPKHSPICLGLNNTFPSNSNTSISLFSKIHNINI